ncbi:MAG TPA: tetratricopeptide repeat protein [Pirellulales bacterium]|nr:tetratricopeptide repeat protein [Pirellulales bacterium]
MMHSVQIKRPHRFEAICALGMLFGLWPDVARGAEDVGKLVTQSRAAWQAGDAARAVELATKAVEAGPDKAATYLYRGTLYEMQRKHAEAVADFDRAIELDPRNAEAYDHRGSERFKQGRFADSITDFDRAIALDPAREAGHWKRGISYYYVRRYDDGRKQFEHYQTVDNNDVENAVWRFLCMARQDGVPVARRELLKIKQDRRAPMMEIYALFAGQATPDQVLAAARSGDPPPDELRTRLFYADIYLGLYYEALGEEAKARQFIESAAQREISHYMWDVAKVHAELLKRSGK